MENVEADYGFWVAVPYGGDPYDGKTELRCIECALPDEDPAPWCDCRHDETCGDHGPCRRRAHRPHACPTPGRW